MNDTAPTARAEPGCDACREVLPFDYSWPCAQCAWPGPMIDPAGLGKDWQNAEFFQEEQTRWSEVVTVLVLLVASVLVIRAFGAGDPTSAKSTGTALEQAGNQALAED